MCNSGTVFLTVVLRTMSQLPIPLTACGRQLLRGDIQIWTCR